ncbi:MAG: ABC transporter substrate-binding protein, partial [Pseudonocardia sp.]|nr:ABC transporter substrate-binding protein [Pseudonocardia sp.]
GDVDVIDRAAPQDLEAIRDDPGLAVRPVTSLGYMGIDINIGNADGASKPPRAPDFALAQNQTLRKAFELSLDRAVLNKVVFNGAYMPDCSPLPPGPWAVPVECTRRDLATAKDLVRESGVPTPIPVTLMTANVPLYEQLCTLVQAMAKEAGFDVSVQPTDFATGLARGRAGNFQTFFVGWSGRIDPDQNISQIVLPGSALNYSGTLDPRVGDLVNAARTSTDPAERRRVYTELVGLLNDDLGIIYLYHEVYVLGLRKKINGVGFFGDGLIRMKEARLEP